MHVLCPSLAESFGPSTRLLVTGRPQSLGEPPASQPWALSMQGLLSHFQCDSH